MYLYAKKIIGLHMFTRAFTTALYAAAFIMLVPEATHATRTQIAPLQTLVDASDAIVIATVSSIDEHASDDPDTPLTTIELDVHQWLRGRGTGDSLELVFRGGVTPQGLRQTFSNVPQLRVGDRYILALRSDFYISPIVPDGNALLRLAQLSSGKVFVDASGRSVRGSRKHGLMRGVVVADSLVERSNPSGASRQPEMANRRPSSHVENLPSPQDVIEVFRQAIKNTPRKPDPLHRVPLSLPHDQDGNPNSPVKPKSPQNDSRNTTDVAEEDEHDDA